jgi:dTDP-4-amino-4,6-dideoxygalactose transaminase
MVFMNNFNGEPRALREAMLSAVSRVFDSGRYMLGTEVQGFEAYWAGVCGVSNAVGLGNGMDAIEVALRALDIGTGDEVITTPMTAFATVLAIIRAGATPVLADIEPSTALLSRDSVERCISKKTKAVVLVHLYGQIKQMIDWQEFCAQEEILLIEDCAQSHLASQDGRVAGSYGIAGAYSFYPTKNLGTPGDAGALVTNNSEVAERASRLRNYGQSDRYNHPELGLNSRLDELHAAILLERSKWLSEFTARRQGIARAYFDGIRNPVVRLLAEPEEPSNHVYHLFVITTDYRDALRDHLEVAGIQTLIHYPIPVHMQESCKNVQRDPSGLSGSELHSRTCLSLPCHPQMSNKDLISVIDAVNAFRPV